MTAASDELHITKKGLLARLVGGGRSAKPPVGVIEDLTASQSSARRDAVKRVDRARMNLKTVFQPIVDLRQGHAVGAEALTRFGESRRPDEAFAEAAAIGMGVELELSAVRSALTNLRHLPSGLYLSINASAEAIVTEEFRSSMIEVSTERIVLELTEHFEVADYARLGSTLQALRGSGMRLAVDDAGSGYSGLLHILNLRPDIIKLDIGLTQGIDTDPARQALGSALLTFGLNAYDATIIAEGIETKGEFETLRALGCQFGQGFYLGRPGRLPDGIHARDAVNGSNSNEPEPIVVGDEWPLEQEVTALTNAPNVKIPNPVT
jgi:EAL domain-containing protein (putative c-di-GMP-specific phosphodiesterase class I)